ncbi:hypothetical protein [Scytonema sp. PCC 10023]|uniref:hypothetical protein n=1 Tax=Scytonema sp. PCC 10023 TaxID=1680591 RepID=UPI0039C673F1
MLALLMSRKRKPVAYRIDSVILELLAKLAREQNTSVNRFLESHFLKIGIERGLISPDTELLGETRGGDRRSKNEGEDDEN